MKQLPQWLTEPKRKRPNWKKWQEKLVKQLGQIETGSFYQGDGKGNGMLTEAKYTSKESIRIQKEWLAKTWHDSLAKGLEPIIGIKIGEYEIVGIIRRDRNGRKAV